MSKRGFSNCVTRTCSELDALRCSSSEFNPISTMAVIALCISLIALLLIIVMYKMITSRNGATGIENQCVIEMGDYTTRLVNMKRLWAFLANEPGKRNLCNLLTNYFKDEMPNPSPMILVVVTPPPKNIEDYNGLDINYSNHQYW